MQDINELIREFITDSWYSAEKGTSAFAIEHNIDEKTARRIVGDAPYAMTLKTLEKICEARDIKLSDFFTLIKR